MAYITAEYYNQTFHGETIESSELTRLLDAASDAIDMAVVTPITTVSDNVKRATAYEVECLFEQGGISALHGFSAAGSAGGTEHLGDYSVSHGSAAGGDTAPYPVINGIPISPIAISLLRKDGLMNRLIRKGRSDNA